MFDLWDRVLLSRHDFRMRMRAEMMMDRLVKNHQGYTI